MRKPFTDVNASIEIISSSGIKPKNTIFLCNLGDYDGPPCSCAVVNSVLLIKQALTMIEVRIYNTQRPRWVAGLYAPIGLSWPREFAW